MLEEQTFCGLGDGRVGFCTRWLFIMSALGPYFFSTSLLFCACSKHCYLFFCWSSTKQFEIILVSCRCRCFLKNRLLAGVHVVLSVRAELNVLADFQPIQLRTEVQQQGNIKQTSFSTCFNWLDNPEGLNNSFFFFYVIGSYV